MRTKAFDPNATFQTITVASKMTGVSQGYIRAGCKAGEIPHIRIGNVYKVNMPQFRKQLDEESMANATW